MATPTEICAAAAACCGTVPNEKFKKWVIQLLCDIGDGIEVTVDVTNMGVEILCDQPSGVRFLRFYIRDTAGVITTVDRELDGTTPYVVAGTEEVCTEVSLASEYAEDSPHASGDIGQFIMAVRNDLAAVLTSTDLDYSPISVNMAGAVLGDINRNYIASADVATSILKIEDNPHATGHVGVGTLVVRTDTPINRSDTDGDYEFPQISNGRVWNSSQVYGEIADDAADSGNPVKVGAVAKNFDGTTPTSVSAENDRAQLISTLDRRLLVEEGHPFFVEGQDSEATPQTNVELIAAPGAGLSIYITDVIVSNGATVGEILFVEDTAGTPVTRIPIKYMAATGGFVIRYRQPVKITANTNFGYTSTNVTTHSVEVRGYVAP